MATESFASEDGCVSMVTGALPLTTAVPCDVCGNLGLFSVLLRSIVAWTVALDDHSAV